MAHDRFSVTVVVPIILLVFLNETKGVDDTSDQGRATLDELHQLMKSSFEELENVHMTLFQNFADLHQEMEKLNQRQDHMSHTLESMKQRQDDINQRLNGINELQGGLELLTGSQNGVKEKVSELHDKMTLMEELNRTCNVEEQITELQNNFSTEFQRVEESVQKCSSGEQLSNFQVLLETDECADGTHRCSPYAACEDALIQYTCTCLPGYNGDGFSCQDVDECSTETHRCHTNGECHNGMGSYTCTCDPGFSGDGFNCEDVDECSKETHRCHTNGKCHNGMGNYTCTCDPGFSGDGFNCEDVDECSTETHRCHTNGKCHNGMGNYTCTCDPGFYGFNCEAVPCESPSRFFQTLGCVTPITKKMSWEAAKRNCQDMGGRLLEKISSQSELDQLKEQVKGLYTDYVWVGIYRWRWNETGDPIHPSSLWRTGEPHRKDNQIYGCVGLYGSYSDLADCLNSGSIGSLCQTAFPSE